jgi:hypothetical protein
MPLELFLGNKAKISQLNRDEKTLNSESWPLITSRSYLIGRLYSFTLFWLRLFSIEIRAAEKNIPIAPNVLLRRFTGDSTLLMSVLCPPLSDAL